MIIIMALENVTTVITNLTGTTGPVDNYVYLFLIIGGVIGTFLGMIIPYYRARRKFQKEGIDLIFDKDFLKTAAFAFITSVVSIGALYPTLLAGADTSGTYFSIFLAAATTAFTINVGGAWIIGTSNKEAEEQLIVKKSEELKASGEFDKVLAKLKGNVVSPDSTDVDGKFPPPDTIVGGSSGAKNPKA